MIKYLYIPFALLLLFASCSESETDEQTEDSSTELEDNFSVTGNISGAANTTFYLEAQSPQGIIEVAKVTADEQGKFEMIGNIPGFGLYQMRMGEDPNQSLLFTLIPGDHLKLSASKETFATSPKAEGTKWASAMVSYIEKVNEFRVKQEELVAQKDQLSEEELTEQYMILKEGIDQFALSTMKADPANPFNIVLSTYTVPTANFQGWNPENLDVLKSVAEAFKKEFPNSPIAATLENQVFQIDMAYNQFIANASGTRPAPEIALNNPEGKQIPLSSLRGKYVLIDFWASWCAPCRRENPNVVALYNKYKNKGFTVYSVSLDNDKEAWKQAIEKDGLVWPNHVSDLLQWKSPLPQLYGFNGIPHTVLVNKEGMIIGTGLRGPALEQKLKEIFEN